MEGREPPPRFFLFGSFSFFVNGCGNVEKFHTPTGPWLRIVVPTTGWFAGEVRPHDQNSGKPLVYASICVAAAIVWRHRSNLSRLIRGTEPRFTENENCENSNHRCWWLGNGVSWVVGKRWSKNCSLGPQRGSNRTHAKNPRKQRLSSRATTSGFSAHYLGPE